MCTGTLAINQAVKALAIARRYLGDDDGDEPIDLICQPEFVGNSAKCVLRLRMSRPINMDMECSKVTATPSCDPYKTAGAIAGKIRDGERVGIHAVGPDAVFAAVESIFISRRYLKDDRIDIKFAPMFEKVDMKNRDQKMNGIHFATLSKRLDG